MLEPRTKQHCLGAWSRWAQWQARSVATPGTVPAEIPLIADPLSQYLNSISLELIAYLIIFIHHNNEHLSTCPYLIATNISMYLIWIFINTHYISQCQHNQSLSCYLNTLHDISLDHTSAITLWLLILSSLIVWKSALHYSLSCQQRKQGSMWLW